MPELADLVEFQENPEPRCLFVLLVDTSGSMAGAKIQSVNVGLQALKTDLCDNDKARNSVELAIVSFNSKAETIVSFTSPERYVPPTLQAGGSTRFAAAIERGLDLIEERRQTYRQAGVPYYAPWLWAITDGKPTDGDAAVAKAQYRLHASALDPQTRKTRIDTFMVGVQDASDPVDWSLLRRFSPQREPLLLNGIYAFHGMFQWISQSLISVSQSQPGDMIVLPPVQGWGRAGG